MKRVTLLIVVLVTLITLSCRNSSKNCVESMMDEGYSFEEAQEACDEARDDYNSRR